MNIFKSFHTSYENRYDPTTARSITDFLWYGSIRSSFTLLVLSLLLGGWFLYQARSAYTSPTTETGSAETLSRTQLDATLNSFNQRSLQYDALKKGGQ